MAANLMKAISIHAPREGSDKFIHIFALFLQIFLSTLPVRGATSRPDKGTLREYISIHAPREGSDGGHDGGGGHHLAISIHAPREGSDTSPPRLPASVWNFYPRSP